MILKKWLLLFVVIMVLPACSGQQANKHYYQLPIIGSKQPINNIQENNRIVWLESLTLTDFLNDKGIVYQLSDVTYTKGQNHLWLTPLEQQLKESVVVVLSELMPKTVVSTKRLKQPVTILNVTIDGFHGRYDGNIIVSGKWLIEQGAKIVTKPFEYQVEQTEDGYDELVRILAKTWQDEIRQLAESIN